MIINSGSSFDGRTRYSQTSGVVVSTIESSLGLDFKAVILAGLLPYNYVFPQGGNSKEINSWSGIKAMTEEEQNLVQSQMRSIYTACSRARDILYVLSDLKNGSPMEELISKDAHKKSGSDKGIYLPKKTDYINFKETPLKVAESPNANENLPRIRDHITIKAINEATKKESFFKIDLAKYPKQKNLIGKKIGDSFKFEDRDCIYKLTEIIIDKT